MVAEQSKEQLGQAMREETSQLTERPDAPEL